LTAEIITEETIVVPAREGRGTKAAAGDVFSIVCLEGRQGGDLWAFCVDEISEFHSAEHTRVHVGRLFPRVGEYFVTNRRRPILRLEEDTLPFGQHDLQIAACDPPRYQLLGVEGWHASCQENLQKVMAEFGFDKVNVPQPINVMANFPVREDGRIDLLPCVSRAGDLVKFRVELDSYIVFSSCPQDIIDINHRHPTAMAIKLERRTSASARSAPGVGS
jgi:uncharacterized protein YcgI (DUF1989 family)